ncbi:unnamed protein product [Arctia plantaginis]|uniref:Uncharacterized protein n=1 Tax=Arctia plantaginis TaxID=874455 RepID=A0A8S1B4C3_ARCPL|nr:unnamed protein product [Arctia plantaginis]CAB3254392.1 unnamed protein product [Arctia plantaginis]
MYVLFVVFLINIGFSSAKEFVDKLDRYIIACHTTDFECFKRQYKALRDNVLLGNDKLGIPLYKHYVFEYGKSTCVKLSGLEESELTSISMEHYPNRYTMTLELPLRIQQVKNSITKQCARPDRDFEKIKQSKGAMMRFSGNATVEISFPFKLRKKKREVYLKLEDEDLDVILDIPDLSHFDMTSEVESKLFEWSEWAYEVVQHVDAAQNFALPYTSQMRTLMEHIPLRRFLMLYPEEDFIDARFSFKKEI